MTNHVVTIDEGSSGQESIGSGKPIGDEGFIVRRQGLASVEE